VPASASAAILLLLRFVSSDGVGHLLPRQRQLAAGVVTSDMRADRDYARAMPAAGPFTIEFYESPTGDKPVLGWIRQELSVRQRRALGYALYRLLQRYGVGICETEFGRQLG